MINNGLAILIVVFVVGVFIYSFFTDRDRGR